MVKTKRVLNLRAASTAEALELMRALGELEVEVIAESYPGGVKAELYASPERIRKLEREIADLAKRSRRLG